MTTTSRTPIKHYVRNICSSLRTSIIQCFLYADDVMMISKSNNMQHALSLTYANDTVLT
ncbi:hypothetical protein BDC45DRAFT_438686 [Circinella umbellata]|nr:hypothetical protein BDC45DRAFT_438686 [Circinella umbellata]